MYYHMDLEQMSQQMKSTFERVDHKQEIANNTGLSYLELESSWWGNEKLGQWHECWWVQIDYETEDAFHLKTATQEPTTHGHRTIDVWLPKSKADILLSPDWSVHTPDGQSKGTLVLEQPKNTQYGPKHSISGDTYEAFKEDGLSDELPWEKTHATWNGDAWTIDANASSVNHLIEKANKIGYEVQTLE